NQMHKRDIEPAPPGIHIAHAGHHWLMVTDFDGRFHGLVVMQWQPGAKRWCHSGDVATGRDVDASGWEYVEPVAQPTAHLAPVSASPEA
ncbi:MAG: hypothetical protein PW734_08300, partial [Verrucomicrobium sp.]|nr:hypothetical protein [Verrucomicrobium sp.]